jgi:hypothetical protein
MANTFLNPDQIAKEALVLLQSNLVVTRLFSRRYEADLNPGSKIGDTVRLRPRSQGVVDEYNGSTITIRDITETSINLVLEKHFDASIRITDKQRTLDIVDFSEQVLAPRMVEMGEKIDTYGLTKIQDIPNTAGPSENVAGGSTAAALPASIANMALVEKTLNDLKVPLNPRYQIASTEYKAVILGVTSFTEADKRGATTALEFAQVGPIMGLQTFMAQNVDATTFTAGTQTAAVVDGSGAPIAAGSTVIPYDGAAGSTGTIVIGDLINIAGYGNVVAAAADTAVASAGTLTIKEPLREDVADDAVMTMYDGNAGTFQRHGAVFHPDCLAFVSAPLDLPVGAEAAYVQDPATGLSIRAVFDYDRDLKADVLSLDILVGASMVDGRLGAQIVKNI